MINKLTDGVSWNDVLQKLFLSHLNKLHAIYWVSIYFSKSRNYYLHDKNVTDAPFLHTPTNLISILLQFFHDHSSVMCFLSFLPFIPQLTIKFFNIAWNFKFKRHQRAITSSCAHFSSLSLTHSKLLGLKMIGFSRQK